MMKQIANEECLLDKARLPEARNFKPGTDGMSASGAVLWIDINGKRLCRELNKGYYEPMPAVAFTSAKKNGSYRRLAKLTAIDSVVQYAVADAIAEKCEAEFSPKSFAYRKGRGVSEAIELYCINARNYRLAAKIDPVACFDNIDYRGCCRCRAKRQGYENNKKISYSRAKLRFCGRNNGKQAQ